MATTLPNGLFAFSLDSKDAARWPTGLARLSAENVASYLRFPDGKLSSFSKLVNNKKIGEALAFIDGIPGTGYTFRTVHARLKRNRGGYGGAASETSDWDANDRFAQAMAMVYKEAQKSLATVGHAFTTDGSLENPECLYKIWVLLQFMKRNSWGKGTQKQSAKYLGKTVEEFKYEDFVSTAQETTQYEEREQDDVTTEQVAKNFLLGPSQPKGRRVVVRWVNAPENPVYTEHETTASHLRSRPYNEFVFEAATALDLQKVWHKVTRLEQKDELGAWEEIYEEGWPQVQESSARPVTSVQDQDMVIRLYSEPHDFDLDDEDDYWEEFQSGRTAVDVSRQRLAMALLEGQGFSAQAREQLCRGFSGPLLSDTTATDTPSADNAGEEDERDPEEVSARSGHKGARDFLILLRVGMGPRNFSKVPAERYHSEVANTMEQKHGRDDLAKIQRAYLFTLEYDGKTPMTETLDRGALERLDKKRRHHEAFGALPDDPAVKNADPETRDAEIAAMIERAENATSVLFEGPSLEKACLHLSLPFNESGKPGPLLPNQKSDAHRLRPSQITGLSFVMRHIEQHDPGCLIADETGTGKTLIYAAVISEHIRRRLRDKDYTWPVLVIVPSAILTNVVHTLLQFGINLRIMAKDRDGEEEDEEMRKHRVKVDAMKASPERSDRFDNRAIQTEFACTARGTATVYLTTPGVVSRRFVYNPKQYEEAERRRRQHIARLRERRRNDGEADIYRDEDDAISISDFLKDESLGKDDGEADDEASLDFMDPVKPRSGAKNYRIWPRYKRWGMVVVDEAHMLRSSEGRLWQAVLGLQTDFKPLITATPMFNHTDNFTAYLRLFWDPERASPPYLSEDDLATASNEDFNPYRRIYDDSALNLFRRSPLHFRRLLRRGYDGFNEVDRFEAMQLLLTDIQLRRTMETKIKLAEDSTRLDNFQQVGAGIPDYTVIQVKLRFTPAELQEYTRYITLITAHLFVKAKEAAPKGGGDDISMDAGLAKLLHLLGNSLRLARLQGWLDGEKDLQKGEKGDWERWFKDPRVRNRMGLSWMARRTTYEDEVLPDREADNVEFMRAMTYGAPKVRFLCKLVRKHCLEARDKQEHHQIVVFVQYPDTQKYLTMFFQELWLKVEALDATINYSQRDRIVIRFGNGAEIEILICEYSMTGGGADLQHQCSVVIIFEASRSAAAELQAFGRVRRWGQRCKQKIYRLLVRDTFDEWIGQKQWKELQDGAISWGSDTLVALQEYVGKTADECEEPVELEGGKSRAAAPNLLKEVVRRLNSVYMDQEMGEGGQSVMDITKEKKRKRPTSDDESRE